MALLLSLFSVGPAGASQCLEARWLFEGTGADETGQHHVTLIGDAHFVPTPGGQGLFTDSASGYAEYQPPIGELAEGQIGVQFFLHDTFAQDPTYANPIGIIGSNRDGHNLGDAGIRLDPADGKLWFVQEEAGPEWTLRTNKDYWESGWYTVIVTWNSSGRMIRVYWDAGSDWVTDDVVAPCFSADATYCWISYRGTDSPPNGLTIGTLEVLAGPPFVQAAPDPDTRAHVPFPELSLSSPNPMSRETLIEYSIHRAGSIALRIYDATGRHVRTLVDEVVPAGCRTARWDGLRADGSAAPAGVYFCNLGSDGHTASSRIVLTR